MSEIRVPYTGASVIQVGGECYFLKEITTGNITHMAVDGEFSDCADCSSDLEGGNQAPECNDQIPPYPSLSSQISLVSSSAFSSSLLSSLDSSLALDSSLSSSSSEALQSFLFSTTDTDIFPAITTSDASLATWDFGDGTVVIGDNAPAHTYTDGAPSHDVSLGIDDPLSVIAFVAVDARITSIDLTPYTNLEVLLVQRNLIAGSIQGLEGLTALTNVRVWLNNINFLPLTTLVNITYLDCRSNPLTDLPGLENLTQLETLIAFSCLFTDDFDTSAMPNLHTYRIQDNPSMGSISIASNPLLTAFEIRNTGRTEGELNQYLIDLDTNGAVNGYFDYSNNPEDPTSSSYDAYQALLAKGWTIVGPAPEPAFPYTLPITFTP